MQPAKWQSIPTSKDGVENLQERQEPLEEKIQASCWSCNARQHEENTSCGLPRLQQQCSQQWVCQLWINPFRGASEHRNCSNDKRPTGFAVQRPSTYPKKYDFGVFPGTVRCLPAGSWTRMHPGLILFYRLYRSHFPTKVRKIITDGFRTMKTKSQQPYEKKNVQNINFHRRPRPQQRGHSFVREWCSIRKEKQEISRNRTNHRELVKPSIPWTVQKKLQLVPGVLSPQKTTKNDVISAPETFVGQVNNYFLFQNNNPWPCLRNV